MSTWFSQAAAWVVASGAMGIALATPHRKPAHQVPVGSAHRHGLRSAQLAGGSAAPCTKYR
jgi:hypothetical protein